MDIAPLPIHGRMVQDASQLTDLRPHLFEAHRYAQMPMIHRARQMA
jgi:hypothetical protein